jgi:hypothetical protein
VLFHSGHAGLQIINFRDHALRLIQPAIETASPILIAVNSLHLCDLYLFILIIIWYYIVNYMELVQDNKSLKKITKSLKKNDVLYIDTGVSAK